MDLNFYQGSMYRIYHAYIESLFNPGIIIVYKAILYLGK